MTFWSEIVPRTRSPVRMGTPRYDSVSVMPTVSAPLASDSADVFRSNGARERMTWLVRPCPNSIGPLS